ncbi:alpha/beta fold hydrolase [Phaeobacter sp. JH20_36]|uniref:alpha/beta fold hydrolase n=1 Tax=unclassified Phaeobacter TaxID=2621772 RepID=UPI003A878E68
MTDLLLVHGSCHGSWCWRDVLPQLEARGINARTIDLPGPRIGGNARGCDPVAVTLEETVAAVRDAARSETIVVGHSWAGYPMSAAADIGPPLRGLIYLCAYVPRNGLSMIDMRKRGPSQPLIGKVMKTADGQSYCFDPEAAPDLLYHDCPRSVVDYALSRLAPQPIRPQDTPVKLGPQWAATPKAYIRCTRDRVIPPEYQAEMVADWPTDRIKNLDTSHSPFFAAPDQLATVMATIVKDL